MNNEGKKDEAVNGKKGGKKDTPGYTYTYGDV